MPGNLSYRNRHRVLPKAVPETRAFRTSRRQAGHRSVPGERSVSVQTSHQLLRLASSHLQVHLHKLIYKTELFLKFEGKC